MSLALWYTPVYGRLFQFTLPIVPPFRVKERATDRSVPVIVQEKTCRTPRYRPSPALTVKSVPRHRPLE